MARKARTDSGARRRFPPLLLYPAQYRKIDRVMSYAMDNPVSVSVQRAIMAGQLPATGLNPKHRVVVPKGYLCVFSINETLGSEYVRYLSVSVGNQTRPPPVTMLQALMKAFGFEREITSDQVLKSTEQGPDFVAAVLVERLSQSAGVIAPGPDQAH